MADLRSARRRRGRKRNTAFALLATATAVVVATAGTTVSAAADDVDRDAEMVVSLNGFTQTVDPHKNTGGNRITTLYLSYDRLIHLTPEGDFIPGLATEWEMSADAMEIELQLRDGVVFHDGTPFTAEAVQASIERAQSLEDPAPLVQTASQRIADVEPLDDLAVRITFTEPYPDAPYDLATQLGAMISPTALAGGVDLDAEDAGAGPYRLVTWRPGESVVYERFEDYWEPADNPLARLEIRNLTDTQTRLNAVQSGEADLVELETALADDAEAAGLQVTNFDTTGAYMVWINGELFTPWQDVRIRQALQHAVNRDGLVAALTDGLAEPAIQPFGSTYQLYNEDYPADFYEYDPERARELLAEAEASDLSLGLLVLNRPVDVAIAEALQSQLAEAGVTLELTVTEPQNFTVYTAGDSQALLGTWSGRLNAVQTLADLYAPGGLLNPGSWSTPELQEAFEQARAMPVGEERDAVLRDAFGLVAEQALGLTLFTFVATYATNDCVVGFQPSAASSPDLRGVGIRSDCA